MLGEKRVWHIMKHRKVTLLELGEAFDMRGRVIAGMIVLSLVAMFACVWGVKSMLQRRFWWW